MPFLLACGVCGYWIAWSRFPPVTFWVLIFAGWFLALSMVRSFGRAEIPGALRLPGALLALGITAILSVIAGGPFVAAWLPLACLAGAAGLLWPHPWEAARPWARPAAGWVAGIAILLLAATAVFETRRAARLSPAERVLLTESTPVAGAELKKITECAPLQEVIRGAVSDRKLVEKAVGQAREVCSAGDLDRFLAAEVARVREVGGGGEWKVEVLEHER